MNEATTVPTATPEKLSIWDRWFNRYKKTFHTRGEEPWTRTNIRTGNVVQHFKRDYVEYLITDRITGSQTIERKYLN